jgi:hypothetical protein
MILLTSATDVLRIVTTSTATVDVYAAYVDLVTATVTPGSQKTAVSTATTTTVVSAPGSGSRNIKSLFVRNRHASTSVNVTVEVFNGTTAYQVNFVTLAASEALHYDEDGGGWSVRDTTGRIKSNFAATAAAVNTLNTVVLAADVINNNAVANTMQDVTALSFAVTAGETYWFKFTIPYTAAATTTGSRWAVSGPASPTLLHYTSTYTLTATTQTVNYATAYDIPAASNATSLTAGNVARIEGHVRPSAGGTVIARFASEVLSSAITAKAGALLQWMRVL